MVCRNAQRNEPMRGVRSTVANHHCITPFPQSRLAAWFAHRAAQVHAQRGKTTGCGSITAIDTMPTPCPITLTGTTHRRPKLPATAWTATRPVDAPDRLPTPRRCPCFVIGGFGQNLSGSARNGSGTCRLAETAAGKVAARITGRSRTSMAAASGSRQPMRALPVRHAIPC